MYMLMRSIFFPGIFSYENGDISCHRRDNCQENVHHLLALQSSLFLPKAPTPPNKDVPCGPCDVSETTFINMALRGTEDSREDNC